MSKRIQVKICGITTREAMHAALRGGADFIGLAFFQNSKRALTLDAAAVLRREIPPSVKAVAFVVDADDAALQDISRQVAPDVFQLHGDESLERSAEIRAMTGKPIIKAIPVARGEDLSPAAGFEGVADWLMFDAKPAQGALAPGGSGKSFDWRILSGRSFRRPWFLAGGLNASNIKAAVEVSGARLLDVSSGVESAPGIKDPALIRAFLDTAKAL